jgi:hypothetical protein
MFYATVQWRWHFIPMARDVCLCRFLPTFDPAGIVLISWKPLSDLCFAEGSFYANRDIWAINDKS